MRKIKIFLYKIWQYILKKNIIVMIFSFLLAFISSFIIYKKSELKITLLFKIHFINTPDHFYTYDLGDEKKLLIQLEGSKENIESFLKEKENIYFFIDLKNAQEGKMQYPIKMNYDPLLEEKVKRIQIKKNKEFLFITFKKNKTKEIPIKLQLKNLKDYEYKINHLSYYPNKIEIKGAEEILNQIKSIKTVPFLLKDNIESFILPIDYPRKLKSIDIDNKYITVYINWKKNIEEKIFKNLEFFLNDNQQKLFTKYKTKLLKLDWIKLSTDKGQFKKIKKSIPGELIPLNNQNFNSDYLICKIIINNFDNFIVLDYQPKKLTLFKKNNPS